VLISDPVADVALGPHEIAGAACGESTGHTAIVRAERAPVVVRAGGSARLTVLAVRWLRVAPRSKRPRDPASIDV
jgi:hypothetical protein